MLNEVPEPGTSLVLVYNAGPLRARADEGDAAPAPERARAARRGPRRAGRRDLPPDGRRPRRVLPDPRRPLLATTDAWVGAVHCAASPRRPGSIRNGRRSPTPRCRLDLWRARRPPRPASRHASVPTGLEAAGAGRHLGASRPSGGLGRVRHPVGGRRVRAPRSGVSARAPGGDGEAGGARGTGWTSPRRVRLPSRSRRCSDRLASGWDSCAAVSACPARGRISLPAPVEPAAVGPDDIAVAIAFTSGSTGAPKGILQRHGSMSHFLPFLAERFGIGPEDRFSLLSGLSHDPFQRDLFTSLCLGASVCAPTASRR